jgi:hypothetical protein
MSRLTYAWRELRPEQRRVALASLGLFISMFLPWYDKTDTVVVHGAAKATQTSLSAFQAFSFVEAAVLLVSAGVLTMLFARAEGRTFQLPGGDGAIVMLAGGWTALLIFYRLLDKPELQGNERITATVGVEWGIFIALLLALGVVFAGARMRADERPEPPLRRARGARPRAPVDPRRTAQPPRRSLRPPHASVEASSRVVETQHGVVEAQPLAEARSPTDEDATVVRAGGVRRTRPSPVPAREGSGTRPRGGRARFPPAPPEQLSFEDPPASSDQ